jgi:hypothetical protein
MLYQKRLLAGSVDQGEPGPLPADLVGLSDASLANLDWTYEPLGYRGYGFFPILEPIVPLSITNYQTVRENIERGTSMSALDALIVATEDPEFIAYFAKETVFRRDHEYVEQLRVLFEMSHDDMDEFFLDAARW